MSNRYVSNAFDNLMRRTLTPERLAKCIEAYNWESGYAWGDDARTHAERMVAQLCVWYESLYNEEYTPSDLKVLNNMETKATKAGTLDAQGFILENDLQTLVRCLQPGQSAPDDSLISALGAAATAKLFGVRHGTGGWEKACREYNTAWLRTIAAASDLTKGAE